MEKYSRIIELIYDFSVVTNSFPAIVCLFRWRNFDLTLRVFAAHTGKGAVITITALFVYYQGLSNRPSYYVDACLDIFLISIISALIIKRKNVSMCVMLISTVFSVLMIYDYFHSRTEKLVNTQLISLETLYVIIVTLILLRIVSSPAVANRYKNSLIWLLSAIVLSNLFSLLFSSLNEIVLAYSNELFKQILYISSPLVSILINCMLSYGYLLPRNIIKPS